MKLLLLGKNGQLGSEIHKQSLERGLSISAFGREKLDITNFEQVKDAISSLSPEIIINCSAYHVVPECETYPEKAFLVNCLAIKNLAEACVAKNIRLVTYSTDYVFDGLKGSPYEENDRPNPLQMYGLSKYAGEIIALNYHTESIVIRTCGVYGGHEGSRSKKGNFVLNILEQAKTKGSIEVSSEQIVNPTYSVDLAAATLALLEKDPQHGIYHVANEGYYSWAEFAQKIIEMKGLQTRIIPIDMKGMVGSLRRPLFSALENRKAKELGVELSSIDDALKHYLAIL